MDASNLITVQTLKTAVERLKSEFGELGGGTLYGSVKSDLSASDTSIIEAYFAQDGAPTPKADDVYSLCLRKWNSQLDQRCRKR